MQVEYQNKHTSIYKNFFSSVIASIIGKTIASPIERVKYILQNMDAHDKIIKSPSLRYKGTIDCFQRILKEEGFIHFWRGYLTNISRYVIVQSLNFTCKDYYNNLWSVNLTNFGDNQNQKKILVNFLAGGTAGITSQTITYPFEVIRVRLATDI